MSYIEKNKSFINTIPSSHTGNLTETIIGSILIPANTFKDGDVLSFLSMNVVDTDACINKFYINTTNDLAGQPKQLLFYNQGSSINIKLFADFFVNNNTLKGWKNETTNSISVYGNIAFVQPNHVVNFNVDQYLIQTVTLGISSKIFTLQLLKVTRIRA